MIGRPQSREGSIPKIIWMTHIEPKTVGGGREFWLALGGAGGEENMTKIHCMTFLKN